MDRKKIEKMLSCTICGEICSRGITMPCCKTSACRKCATQQVLQSKRCWMCGSETPTTKEFLNEDGLRDAVAAFKNRAPVDPKFLFILKTRHEKNRGYVTEDVQILTNSKPSKRRKKATHSQESPILQKPPWLFKVDLDLRSSDRIKKNIWKDNYYSQDLVLGQNYCLTAAELDALAPRD
eukprot:TRINITY_DN10028_c0_g1_i2.p1 TRINITY_DN10028_c0_g1~~TRINITY_DN10028_c0_g1_i2.p1  ORF type:complete len:180 (-),score=18.40 TRINITY_DN10028_c0_g1_i2:292-831(-)